MLLCRTLQWLVLYTPVETVMFSVHTVWILHPYMLCSAHGVYRAVLVSTKTARHSQFGFEHGCRLALRFSSVRTVSEAGECDPFDACQSRSPAQWTDTILPRVFGDDPRQNRSRDDLDCRTLDLGVQGLNEHQQRQWPTPRLGGAARAQASLSGRPSRLKEQTELQLRRRR